MPLHEANLRTLRQTASNDFWPLRQDSFPCITRTFSAERVNLLAPRKLLKLLYQLTLRDVRARFSESILGSVWLLLSPLVQLGVFTIVFGQLLPRPVGADRSASYGCFLALGLWPWLMFSDAILQGSAAISKNANMVKKIAFPRTALVHAAVTGAFLIHGSGFLAVLVVLTLAGQPISASGLLSTMAYLICLYGIALGAAALFGGLQTAIRDIDHALPSGLTLLYFLTPNSLPLRNHARAVQSVACAQPHCPVNFRRAGQFSQSWRNSNGDARLSLGCRRFHARHRPCRVLAPGALFRRLPVVAGNHGQPD